MVEMGIIQPSNSPWASPPLVVPKADGGWRPCGDYRKLNVAMADDRYPLPHIRTLLLGRHIRCFRFLCLGPGARVPSNPDGARRHKEDSYHHSIRPFRISPNAFRVEEFGLGLSEADEWCSEGHGACLCLLG